jgi:20S proteasome alpha/beta subunit
MTTIVTTQSKSYAVMVSDQGITSDLIHPQMPKIIKQGTWLIGVCGTDRVCDVIQYTTKLPKVPETLIGKPIEDWYPWIVSKVITEIQKAVHENLGKDTKELDDSDLLLVTHGHAFYISETLGLSKAEPYWSVGSGSKLALGYLTEKNSRPDWNIKHAEFAKESIAVAEKLDPFTRGTSVGYKSFSSGKITNLG